jgi:hypothetical protein
VYAQIGGPLRGKPDQTTTNHQSENDADTQERVAPTGQFNVARMCRPSLIGDCKPSALVGQNELIA